MVEKINSRERWLELKEEMPEITDKAELIKNQFGLKAIGIRRTNGEIAFYAGKFDPPKDLSVKSNYRKRK